MDRSRLAVALALLDDYHPTAIDDTHPTLLRAFFASCMDRDAARNALPAEFAATPVDIADEGWAERSQAALRAVSVGGLTIAPPWDVPVECDPSATIIIRPSMGFGTGHHATTRLCLRALQTVGLDGTRVIDIGTGSGVLAIAAARRGAAYVLALDADGDATSCALENVAVNGVSARVSVVTADAHAVGERGFDLAIANLTSALLRRLSERVLRMVRGGGYLILSGFMLHEEDAVAAAYGPPARLVRREEEDEWGVLVLRTPPYESPIGTIIGAS